MAGNLHWGLKVCQNNAGALWNWQFGKNSFVDGLFQWTPVRRWKVPLSSLEASRSKKKSKTTSQRKVWRLLGGRNWRRSMRIRWQLTKIRKEGLQRNPHIQRSAGWKTQLRRFLQKCQFSLLRQLCLRPPLNPTNLLIVLQWKRTPQKVKHFLKTFVWNLAKAFTLV